MLCSESTGCLKGLETTASTGERLHSLLDLHSLLLSHDLGVLLHELGHIQLGSLQHLHLADQSVLNREHLHALLLDSLTHGLVAQLGDQLSQRNLAHLLSDDLGHLSADLVHLRRLGVAGLLVLVLLLAGEGNAEQAELVAVVGGDLHVALNQSLPLLDQRAELVAGGVHAVEESDALITLHVLHAESHLAESEILALVQITEIGLKDTSLESLRGDLQTGSAGHQSSAHLAILELVGSTDDVPLLLSHGIDHLLSLSLLIDLLLRLAYKIGKNDI